MFSKQTYPKFKKKKKKKKMMTLGQKKKKKASSHAQSPGDVKRLVMLYVRNTYSDTKPTQIVT